MKFPLVLREKLRPPDLIGLVRPRLENRLSLHRAGTVGLVVAPAGSGKTTLLAQIAAHSVRPTGWYRATADDVTESALVANFLRAIPGVDSSDCPLRMSELLGRLDDVDECLLICDDLQEIAGTPAESALERFVDLRPRSIRLLFGSRRGSPISVPRLRGSGVVAEVDGDALRFRCWEVEELFEKIYREPLRADAAASLTRRTGGWAAGLEMFHLATTGKSTAARHQAVSELGASSRLVRGYLTREVLADLPADQRHFLLRTWALDRVTADMCDELLETTGSSRILAELEQRQLFVSTEDGIEFHYHDVLRTHLELAFVEESGEAAANAWYRRSGEVLARRGRHQAALRVFAKAAQWARVSEIVRDHAADIVDVVDDESGIPPTENWRRDPWLALAVARRFVRDGRLADALGGYQFALELHDEPTYRRQCHIESDALVRWLPRAAAMTQPTPEPDHWSARWRAAVSGPVLTAAASANDADRIANGVLALLAGEFGWAGLSLGRVRSGGPASPLLSAMAGIGLAIVDAARGAGEDAADTLDEAMVVAQEGGLPWLARLAHALQEAVLAVAQGASWRLGTCTQLRDDCDERGDQWGAALVTLMMGVAQLLHGDRSAATGDLRAAARRFLDLDAQVLAVWCQIVDLYTARATNATVAALAAQAHKFQMRGAQALALGALDSLAAEVKIAAASSGVPVAVFRATREQVGHVPVHATAISCFGGLRLATTDGPLDVGVLRPQARSLLAILAMAPERACRQEFLEDALWPHVGHKVAIHRLQVAVSSIRALLAGTDLRVERSGEAYRLRFPPQCHSDVRTFEDTVAHANRSTAGADRIRLRATALETYCGELLPEEGRVEFIAAERERFRAAAAGVALDQAADLWRAEHLDRARQAAELSLRLEPFQDRPWELLVLIHAKLGDHTAAARARRDLNGVRASMGLGARGVDERA